MKIAMKVSSDELGSQELSRLLKPTTILNHKTAAVNLYDYFRFICFIENIDNLVLIPIKHGDELVRK